MSEWKLTSSKPLVKSSIGGKKTTKTKRAGLGGTKKVTNVNFEKLEKESIDIFRLDWTDYSIQQYQYTK